MGQQSENELVIEHDSRSSIKTQLPCRIGLSIR